MRGLAGQASGQIRPRAGENGAELLAGFAQSGGNGASGDPQRCGDLCLRQVQDVAERDHLPRPIWESRHGSPQRVIAGLDRLDRRPRLGRHALHYAALEPVAAPTGTNFVDGDPVQPGDRRVELRGRRPPGQRSGEGLRDGFFGQVTIADGNCDGAQHGRPQSAVPSGELLGWHASHVVMTHGWPEMLVGGGFRLRAVFVRLEVDQAIGTIRLDRPPMNALNAEVRAELKAAADEATVRKDIRAVVVYGGEKVFAAGADIKEMAELTYAEMVDRSGPLQAAFAAVAHIPKPTVAAVTGYALGGGCELALACDVRIAAEDAKLGQPEIQLGLIPGAGGTQRLSRLVGPARAKELIYTGRFVRAEEALQIGLVDQVVPAGEVYSAATTWAARFADGPAYALRAAKEAIDRGLETDIDTGLEIERQYFVGLFATEDRSIGMRSFIENGPGKARFVGR